MSQTLVKIYVHIVFSTKNRENMILPQIEKELFAYIGGTLRKNKSTLIAANGTPNHVHLLISQSKNISLSDLLRELKNRVRYGSKQKTRLSKVFNGKQGLEHFQSGSRKLKRSKVILQSKKNITKPSCLKMNIENFCRNTRLILMNNIF